MQRDHETCEFLFGKDEIYDGSQLESARKIVRTQLLIGFQLPTSTNFRIRKIMDAYNDEKAYSVELVGAARLVLPSSEPLTHKTAFRSSAKGRSYTKCMS